jgi:hypothetical protein
MAYNRSIRLFRLRILRDFMLFCAETSSGNGGSSNMGSRSSAPRATMRSEAKRRVGGAAMRVTLGISYETLACVDERVIMRELRCNFFNGDVLDAGGAVCGVMGEYGLDGVMGVLAAFPFTLESHFRVDGEIAILARERRAEMERRRLCGGDLMMGEAELMVEDS